MLVALTLHACTCAAPEGGAWEEGNGPGKTDTPPPDTQAPALHWVDIDAGGFHSCGVLSDGRLVCWGEDDVVEKAHADIVDFVGVSVANRQGCGLKADGSVHCWCEVYQGTNALCDDMPTGLDPERDGFVEVQVGADTACGQFPDDTLRCWGWLDTAGVPTEPVLDWAVEQDSACAILADHTLHCWGGATVGWDGWPPPGDVFFSKVAVGRTHACALDLDGFAHCWGTQGHLNPDGSRNPFPQGPEIRFSDLAAYSQITCGLEPDGTASCWYGFPLLFDLDDKLSEQDGGPAWEPPEARWATIGLGEWDACGITLDGEARCWPELGDSEGEVTELPTLAELAR